MNFKVGDKVIVQFGNETDTEGTTLAQTTVIGFEEGALKRMHPLVLYVSNDECFIGFGREVHENLDIPFKEADIYCCDCRPQDTPKFEGIKITKKMIKDFKVLKKLIEYRD